MVRRFSFQVGPPIAAPFTCLDPNPMRAIVSRMGETANDPTTGEDVLSARDHALLRPVLFALFASGLLGEVCATW